jgi:hypothetical protein
VGFFSKKISISVKKHLMHILERDSIIASPSRAGAKKDSKSVVLDLETLQELSKEADEVAKKRQDGNHYFLIPK